jgi:hypothetical protein
MGIRTLLTILLVAAAGAHVARSSRLLPPPGLGANRDWLTVTTGPTDPGVVAPSVWAITAFQGMLPE